VRTRSKYISLIGALARREGCRITTASLVESEETCVRVEEERKCLTQGRRFTESIADAVFDR
jgi:hypothetical protein